MSDIIALTGSSGRQYNFNIYNIDARFNDIGGVYAVTKRILDNRGIWIHTVYYIGIAANLSHRFSGHHKLDECIRLGANCICIHPDLIEASRELKERDLISFHKPKFNELLKMS